MKTKTDQIQIALGFFIALGLIFKSVAGLISAYRQYFGLAIALLLLGSNVTFADQLQLSFNPDTGDLQKGIVKFYSVYQQPTNAPDKNIWQYLYDIPLPSMTVLQVTSIIDVTNLPPTNCLLAVTATGLSRESYKSAPFFYDLPALRATALANAQPKTPTALGGNYILK